MKKRIGTGIQVVLGLLFVLAGAGKFLGPRWPRLFESWHYPSGTYAVVGCIEIAAGVALCIPAIARYAAGVLALVMIGAVTTLLMHPGTLGVTTPILYLCLLVASSWLLAAARRGV